MAPLIKISGDSHVFPVICCPAECHRGNICIEEDYEENYIVNHFNLYGGFNELW